MMAQLSTDDTLSALEKLTGLLHQHSEHLTGCSTASQQSTTSNTSPVLASIAELQAATNHIDECLQAQVKNMSQRLSTLKTYTQRLGTRFPDFAPTLQHVMSTPARTSAAGPAQDSASPLSPGSRGTAGVCSPLMLPRTPMHQATSPTTGSDGSPATALRSPLATPARMSQGDAAAATRRSPSVCHATQSACGSQEVIDFLATLAPVENSPPPPTVPSRRRPRQVSHQLLAHVDELLLSQLRADGIHVETAETRRECTNMNSSSSKGRMRSLCEKVLVDIRAGLFTSLSVDDAATDASAQLNHLFPSFDTYREALLLGSETCPPADAPEPPPAPVAEEEAQTSPSCGRRRRPRSPPTQDAARESSSSAAAAASSSPTATPRSRVLTSRATVSQRMVRARVAELERALFAVVALRHLAKVTHDMNCGGGDEARTQSAQPLLQHAMAYITTLNALPAFQRPAADGSPVLSSQPPPLIALDHVYTMLGYAPLWSQEAPSAHTTGSVSGNTATTTTASHSDVALFVQTVAPFLALWGDRAQTGPDPVTLPRLAQRPAATAQRQSSPHQPLLLLAPCLAPLAWREVTCDYVQTCAREALSWLHHYQTSRAALASGRSAQLALGEWIEARDRAPQDAPSLPPHTGLASIVYPVSRRMLTALTELDQRGLLPCEGAAADSSDESSEDNEMNDDNNGNENATSATVGDTPNGSRSTAIGLPEMVDPEEAPTPSSASHHGAAPRFSLPPPSMASSSTFVGSSVDTRPTSRAETSTGASRTTHSAPASSTARVRSPFLGEAATASYLRTVAAIANAQSPTRRVSSPATAAEANSVNESPPEPKAVSLELPHVSALLRQEAAQVHRSSYGHAVHASVHQQLTRPASSTGAAVRAGDKDTSPALDLLTATAGFDGVDSAVALSQFHSTMLFCPVSRHRCVDPLVVGGILKSDAISYLELQGVPWVDPAASHDGVELSTHSSLTLGPLETAMAELQHAFFVRNGTVVPNRTRNLYDVGSIYNHGPSAPPQSVVLNPPDLLECGHILSHRTVESLLVAPSRHRNPTQRGQTLRCPYCSQDSNVSRIVTVSYLSK